MNKKYLFLLILHLLLSVLLILPFFVCYEKVRLRVFYFFPWKLYREILIILNKRLNIQIKALSWIVK